MSGSVEWEVIHGEVVALAKRGAAHDQAVARTLLRAQRAAIWEPLGMTTIFEYAERYLGLSPRQTEERLRVGASLERLPLLDGALGKGTVHFSVARELSRVATPETEQAWLDAAVDKTAGQVEELVSGHLPGDLPSDPPRPQERRYRVVLDLSGEAYALYREAQGMLRREHGEAFREEDGIILMARAILGGPRDPGRSPYQIRMTICRACGRAEQDGHGKSIPVSAEVAERAGCDPQRLDDSGRATQDIPPATRRLVVARQHGRCGVSGCRNAAYVEIHHIRFRSLGGSHDPENLVLVCTGHHIALHRGTLRMEGTWSAGLRFFHVDGRPYGSTSILEDVHLALRGMGFKPAEARAMVDAVRPHVGADTTDEEALRMALKLGDSWRRAPSNSNDRSTPDTMPACDRRGAASVAAETG